VSGPANLSGTLPAGEANGLGAIAADLVDHPTVPRVVVAILDTKSVRTNVDDGTRVATVRVRRIEVIADPADRENLRRLLMREFERRTGQAVLPFDLEVEVRRAFDTDQQHGDTP
jgi:hypothetical protein